MGGPGGLRPPAPAGAPAPATPPGIRQVRRLRRSDVRPARMAPYPARTDVRRRFIGCGPGASRDRASVGGKPGSTGGELTQAGLNATGWRPSRAVGPWPHDGTPLFWDAAAPSARTPAGITRRTPVRCRMPPRRSSSGRLGPGAGRGSLPDRALGPHHRHRPPTATAHRARSASGAGRRPMPGTAPNVGRPIPTYGAAATSIASTPSTSPSAGSSTAITTIAWSCRATR